MSQQSNLKPSAHDSQMTFTICFSDGLPYVGKKMSSLSDILQQSLVIFVHAYCLNADWFTVDAQTFASLSHVQHHAQYGTGTVRQSRYPWALVAVSFSFLFFSLMSWVIRDLSAKDDYLLYFEFSLRLRFELKYLDASEMNTVA